MDPLPLPPEQVTEFPTRMGKKVIQILREELDARGLSFADEVRNPPDDLGAAGSRL
ncbi:MAG: hypothetical protein M3492_11935 [Actinomycetota bacterium]|nr:hypothetical protein [Actinomycetota bacterium]